MLAYIAGPMTSVPDFNYPAFFAAEKKLFELGYDVLNPARHFGGDQSLPREVYMRAAIEAVMKADCIVTLDRWASSRGANLEVNLGKELGLPIEHIDFIRPCAIAAYSEKDAGNVLSVLWLAIGFVALCAICGVMGWL